jgi:dTDP-4-dehydrorhamnose 3,5-epimerase
VNWISELVRGRNSRQSCNFLFGIILLRFCSGFEWREVMSCVEESPPTDMGFRIESKHLGDLVVLVSEVFEDARGFFMEVYRADLFKSLGLPTDFVQDNHSRSKKGVIRGLHFQWDPPMSKLMRVTYGSALLVAVDIRKGSPTLGQWFGVEVSAENKKQVWAPAGFARGFCVLSDFAEIQYKCTGIYNNKGESGIRWNDPRIGINWPVKDPELSAKDRQAPTLGEWLASANSNCFRYKKL